MVLNFDDELNFQDYPNLSDYKHQRNRKQDTTANDRTPSVNQDNFTLSNDISSHIQIDFSAAEWEYLTNHCIPASTYDASRVEISPSISSQTFQLLRPSFCSEYDTDTTDLMGIVDQQNHHQEQEQEHQQQQHQHIQLQLRQTINLLNCDHQQQHQQQHHHQHHPQPQPQLQLQLPLPLQTQDIHRSPTERQYQPDCQIQLHKNYHLEQPIHTTSNSNTTPSTNCNINQISKPPDDFCFPSNLDYNTFLENMMDKDNLNCERGFTSNTGDATCSTPLFNPENYDHELYMLQQELQENSIPLEPYQPQSLEKNIHDDEEDEEEEDDDFMGPNSDLLTTANTTAVSATTATLLILLILLVKSPSQILVDFDDFVTSPIYEWPSDETCGHVNLMNNIKVRLANLEPKTVSDAVRKTIREEFIIQDLFLNGQSPLPPEIPKSIRKKSDRDVEWTPLSVYKAYTNIKSPANGKEAYNHLVPYTSCIGTLNYRPKDHAAWKRAPNRRR